MINKMLPRSEKYRKYCTLIGAHLILSPLSFLFNYGNLSAYLESYFQIYCAPDCVDGDSQWIVNTFLATGCPGVFLSWYILNRMGPKKAGVLIVLIANAAFIASAWTLQVSIVATALLMGVISGLGIGPTVCIGYMYINGWAGKNAALFIGTTTSAPTLLSIIQNQIITAYINPKNLEPDTQIGLRAYFSQPEILERVPEMVLILAVMGLVLQIIGYALVSDPPSVGSELSEKPGEDVCQGDSLKSSPSKRDKHPTISKDPTCYNDLLSKDHVINDDRTYKQYESTSVQSDKSDTACNRNGHIPTNQTVLKKNLKTTKEPTTVKSVSPLEALKSGEFYSLFFFGFALSYGLILLSNYYKQFGLLFIKNDRFLTLMGSLIPLFSSAVRICLGTSIDNDIFTIQDCLVMSLAVNSILCAFWFFAPQINDILYMALILLLSMSHAMIQTSVGTGVAQYFGPKYFVINYGMVYFGGTLSCIISAVTVTPLRQAFGWFWLFASCGVLSTIALVYTAFYHLFFH